MKFVGLFFFLLISSSGLSANNFEPPADSQKVGQVFELVADKQAFLERAEKEARASLKQLYLDMSHLLAHAHTLKRVTSLQRRYGEEPAGHKKAHLRLVLKRLFHRKIQASTHYQRRLNQVRSEKNRLDQIAQTLQFRAQAWVKGLEG